MLVAEGIGPCDLLINIIGMTTFGVLFYFDNKAADARVQQRKRIRDAQIAFGDRELYVNEQGEKMSRLKEVRGCAAYRVLVYKFVLALAYLL